MYLVMFHKNWKSFLRNIAVTSLAEVWIETSIFGDLPVMTRSLPLRKCGLKPIITELRGEDYVVTSLAEVWIETLVRKCVLMLQKSLPLRKCGLKQVADTPDQLHTCHFPCGSVD